MPEDYKILLGRVANRCFDDVIPRFHIVREKPITLAIFTFAGAVGKAGEIIKLTEGGRRFLIDHGKLVNYVAVSRWARFTSDLRLLQGCTQK